MQQLPVSTYNLAHQGGWDEILIVAGPLVVVASLLWLANKKLNTRLSDDPLEQVEKPDQHSENR